MLLRAFTWGHTRQRTPRKRQDRAAPVPPSLRAGASRRPRVGALPSRPGLRTRLGTRRIARRGAGGRSVAKVRRGGRRRRSSRPGARSGGARRRSWPRRCAASTSCGVVTASVPTCRITSPTARPASAARPSPSSEVMTTPLASSSRPSCSRAAGVTVARVAPSFSEAVPSSGRLPVSSAAWRSSSKRPSCRSTVSGSPWRSTSTLTSASGAAAATSFGSSRLELDALAVEGEDHVAGLELADRGAVRDHVGDQRAVRVVEADRRGDLRAHLLDGARRASRARPRRRRGAGRSTVSTVFDGIAKPTPTEPPFGE